MEFKAEVIRTSQRKLASNDNQYEVVLRTDNPLILDLGKLPSDTILTISIEPDSKKSVYETYEEER